MRRGSCWDVVEKTAYDAALFADRHGALSSDARVFCRVNWNISSIFQVVLDAAFQQALSN